MRKTMVMLLLLIVGAMQMLAGPVSLQEAQDRAADFLKSRGKSVRTATQARKRMVAKDDQAAEQPAFYVFDAESDAGFVIVSADDRTTPILGYTDSGSYDEDKLPPNFKAWLDSYVEQFKMLPKEEAGSKARSAVVSSPDDPSWQKIEPLLKTKWGQSAPFNTLCPLVNGALPPAGCVATAMAQIMYYHKWPAEATAAIPAYSYEGAEFVTEDLPPVVFEWDKMPLSNKEVDEDNAVATLMRYAGQSVEMYYGLSGSAAVSQDVPSALCTTFGYDQNIRFYYRDHFSSKDWHRIVYTELSENRPVLYGGLSIESGGHAFVCDGYDGNGLYHINWGWNGSGDGYFSLEILNDMGIDAPVNEGFNYMQDIITGIQPPTGKPAEPLYLTTTNIFLEDGNAYFTTINQNAVDANFDLGVAIENSDTSFDLLFSYVNMFEEVNGGWYLPLSPSHLESHAPGSYRIVPVSRQSGVGAAWQRCTLSSDYYVEAIVDDAKNVSFVVHPQPVFTVEELSCPNAIEAFSENELKLSIKNSGDEYYGIFYFYASLTEEKGEPIYTPNTVFHSNTTTEISINFNPSKPGKYNVWIYSDYDRSKVILQTTLDVVVGNTSIIDVNNVLYNIETGSAVVYRQDPTLSGDIIIPESITHDGTQYPVVAVADSAFWGTKITSITLPNDITSLSSNCFAECYSLTSVNLPEKLMRIGWCSFYRCTKLSSISIPERVTYIDNAAFSRCQSLTSITIPEGVTYIGASAFYRCEKLESINIPQSITSLSHYCFNYCTKLTSIFLPANIRQIYRECFQYCSALKKVECEWTDLSVLTVQDPATCFEGIPADAELYVPKGTKDMYASTEPWKSAFKTIIENNEGGEGEPTDQPQDVTINKIKYRLESGEATILEQGWKVYGNIEIPDTLTYENKKYVVTKIVNRAFESKDITRIVLPSGITALGDSCFWNCKRLESVQLPSKLVSLGESCFEKCHSLSTIFFQNSLQSIGKACFKECSSLVSVNASRCTNLVNISVAPDAFEDCFWEAILGIPYNTKSQILAQEAWSSHFKEENIHEGGVTIVYSFRNNIKYYIYGRGGCAYVVAQNHTLSGDIVIPDSIVYRDREYKVKVIVNHAFQYTDITSITLPSSITFLGNSCFNNCTKLTSLPNMENITSIGDYCFFHCPELTSIELPEGVTSIGKSAFYHCHGVTSLILPKSITYLGETCFRNLQSLQKVVCKWTDLSGLTVESPTSTFNEIPADAELYVPRGTKEMYAATRPWSTSFSKIIEFITEEDRQANEAAYSKLSEQLAVVEDLLEVAKWKIETECKDVAADFAFDIAEIQHDIDVEKHELKLKYDNVELTAESTTRAEHIRDLIEIMLAEAKAAQKAYEEQKAEEEKKQANEEAYTKLSSQLAEAQAMMDDAKTTIEAECKDVAADFADTIAEIQAAIDALTAELESKYENVELTTESTIDTSAITAAIEELLAKAKAAQEAYDETVGIGSIYVDGIKVKAIYSLNGQRVKRPIYGKLYIFVCENGKTVKKVMK